MKSETLLMIADSDQDANMLYAVGMFVPDPFIYLRLHGRSYIVLSDLEIGRARKQAPHCHVISLSRHQAKLRENGIKRPTLAQVAHRVLRERKVRRVVVPPDFPLGLATDLKRIGIRLKLRSGHFFFPEREE